MSATTWPPASAEEARSLTITCAPLAAATRAVAAPMPAAEPVMTKRMPSMLMVFPFLGRVRLVCSCGPDPGSIVYPMAGRAVSSWA